MTDALLSPGRILSLVASLLICHTLWWWTAADAWVLGVLKVLMELALPMVLDSVTGVWRTSTGAWMVGTTFVGPKVSGFAVSIDPFLLRKCVMWIPSALALVAATSFHKPGRVIVAVLLSVGLAAVLTLISAAAMLAIVINPNPTIWSEGLPRAPLVGVEVTPYPDWYFFLVTMGLYFNLNVAALAMPIILWMIVCREDLGRLGLTKS